MLSATLNFDGACGPILKVATIGYVIKLPGGAISLQEGKFLGFGEPYTSNIAEYWALIYGLRELLKVDFPVDNYMVYGDSELVIKQMNGEYAVRHPNLVGLKEAADKIRVKFTKPVIFTWIPREQNTEAHLLAESALHVEMKSNPSIALERSLPREQKFGRKPKYRKLYER